MLVTDIRGTKYISGNSVQPKTDKEQWHEDFKIQFLWILRRSWAKEDSVEKGWKEM